MRQEIVTSIARGLGTVVSRQLSVTLGVWGEPGIGKTTLAGQVLRDLPCEGRSVPARATVPELLAALPCPRHLPPWAEAQRARLTAHGPVDASTQALTIAATLSALAPFVLHLDDVHEVQGEHLRRLTALGRAVRRVRGVGLLATSRTELPPPFRNLRLAALELGETADLLERALGASLPPDGVAWLHRRTGGNPLYALEFTRFLTRQGFLWSDSQEWRWRVPPAGTLPLTVEALITQLVAEHTATPGARAALEARALLPPFTDEPTWRATAGLRPRAFAAACATLRRGGVLRGGALAHPLIGEVVAGALPPERRRVYARRAVRALLPGEPGQAVDVLEHADLERGEARRVIRQALAQACVQDDPMLRARLLGLAAEQECGEARAQLALEAEALLHVGGAEQARARLAQLALDAQPDNREARWRLASALAAMGRDHEVQALVQALPVTERGELRWIDAVFRAQAQATHAARALRTWRAHPELAQVPGSVLMAANAHVNLGDLEAAERVIARGLSLPELPGRARSGLTRLLAFIRSEQGHLEEAERLFEECLRWLEAHGSAGMLAACHYERSFTLYRLGRRTEALDALSAAATGYDEAGWVQYAANARTLTGRALGRLGHFTQAEASLQGALDVLARLELTHSRVNCEWELGLLYAEWRPPHGAALAQKFAHDALEHARTLASPRALLAALCVAARVEAWSGDPARARRLANEAATLGTHGAEAAFDLDAARALALEAGGQPEHALAHWRAALTRTRVTEYQHEAELEVARLTGDAARVTALLAWFEAAGLGALAARARRAVPPPAPAPPSEDRAVRLGVLGPFTVSRGGHAVGSRGRRRAELLAYLLEARLAGRDEVGALELVDALYPGVPEEGALHTLQQQVYLIRSALGGGAVLRTAGGYALGAVSSDAEDFLATGDTGLWRGRYLDGLGEGWLPGVRDALTHALHGRLEALLAHRVDGVGRLARVLCAAAPYDQEALRLALRALQADGQATAAGALYAERRAALLEVGEHLPDALGQFLAGVDG